MAAGAPFPPSGPWPICTAINHRVERKGFYTREILEARELCRFGDFELLSQSVEVTVNWSMSPSRRAGARTLDFREDDANRPPSRLN